MSAPNNGEEIYLEPVVEVNKEVVDPLGVGDESSVDTYNICSPGGC